MKRLTKNLIAAFLLLLLLVPAQASTWRSTSGNMFHFYPGGQMEAYVNGQKFNGPWWWSNNPNSFQFYWYGETATVTLNGQGGVCYIPGYARTYWTMLGSRGGAEERPDTTSWFMEMNAPRTQ